MTVLARARRAGLLVFLDEADRVVVRGPRRAGTMGIRFPSRPCPVRRAIEVRATPPVVTPPLRSLHQDVLITESYECPCFRIDNVQCAVVTERLNNAAVQYSEILLLQFDHPARPGIQSVQGAIAD